MCTDNQCVVTAQGYGGGDDGSATHGTEVQKPIPRYVRAILRTNTCLSKCECQSYAKHGVADGNGYCVCVAARVHWHRCEGVTHRNLVDLRQGTR